MIAAVDGAERCETNKEGMCGFTINIKFSWLLRNLLVKRMRCICVVLVPNGVII